MEASVLCFLEPGYDTLALLLLKEKLGLLEGLVLEVLEEHLWHSVT
jgi:hypothetical protein